MNKQSRSMPLRTGTHALLEEAAYCILMASLNQIRSRADKSDVLSKRQEKLRQSREGTRLQGWPIPGYVRRILGREINRANRINSREGHAPPRRIPSTPVGHSAIRRIRPTNRPPIWRCRSSSWKNCHGRGIARMTTHRHTVRDTTDNLHLYSAVLARVVDGDTVDLHVDLGFHHSLLQRFHRLDVDSPERGKPGWAEATAFVQGWFQEHGSTVIVHSFKGDSFGRWLGYVYAHDGSSLTDDLLFSGHAVKWGT